MYWTVGKVWRKTTDKVVIVGSRVQGEEIGDPGGTSGLSDESREHPRLGHHTRPRLSIVQDCRITYIEKGWHVSRLRFNHRILPGTTLMNVVPLTFCDV